MNCPKCGKPAGKNGKTENGKQKYRCHYCKHNFERPLESGLIDIVETKEKAIGLTESQLRAKFDTRFIVENKCKELKEGIFLTLAEFIQVCGIRPGAGYRGVVDHPDYEKYRGKAGGTTYWSHPASIRKLKDEGVLM